MNLGRIASRVFTMRDQDRFAQLTGDRNPMHVDPLFARRTQAGAPVVHGVHTVLWALEAMTAAGLTDRPVRRLAVRFRKFVYLDDDVEVIAHTTESGLRAEIWSEGVQCTSFDVEFDIEAGDTAPSVAGGASIEIGAPLDLDIDGLSGWRGTFATVADPGLCAMYPELASRFGDARLQGIAALSTLVGMISPGLHSIFDGLSIELTDGRSETPILSFDVVTFDDRFRFLTMSVVGSGFHGTVDAFVRHPPVEQLALREIARHVDDREFSGVDALIVGGSRGLGALTARIIVAGGGRAVITYRVGKDDAEAIAAELGERCIPMALDVTKPIEPQLRALPGSIGQLYYMATTQIFREQAKIFSASRFAELVRYYVDGFADVVTMLAARDSASLDVLYPSSVYVADRPRKMTEYAMAKAAGEVLASDLDRALKNVRISVERLPRVLTDQTSSVIPSDTADSLPIMVSIVRKLTATEPHRAASR